MNPLRQLKRGQLNHLRVIPEPSLNPIGPENQEAVEMLVHSQGKQLKKTGRKAKPIRE